MFARVCLHVGLCICIHLCTSVSWMVLMLTIKAQTPLPQLMHSTMEDFLVTGGGSCQFLGRHRWVKASSLVSALLAASCPSLETRLPLMSNLAQRTTIVSEGAWIGLRYILLVLSWLQDGTECSEDGTPLGRGLSSPQVTVKRIHQSASHTISQKHSTSDYKECWGKHSNAYRNAAKGTLAKGACSTESCMGTFLSQQVQLWVRNKCIISIKAKYRAGIIMYLKVLPILWL